MGVKTLEAQIKDGNATAQGDVSVLHALAETMVEFDPRFEIMPGTNTRHADLDQADAYRAVPQKAIAE
jgi:hypothetical protein